MTTTTNTTTTTAEAFVALSPSSLTVQELVAQVALEVGAIGKNARMEAGPAKYNYRSLDDLINAAHEPLARNGVTFTPHSVLVVGEDKGSTRSGTTQYHVRAIVTYRVYGPNGDYISAAVLAEALDTSDKASNKLMSAAYKYAVSQVLSIPYAMEDQDAERPEPIEAQIPMTDEAVLASISDSADRLNKTVAEVTNKVREQNGGLGPDELMEIDLKILHGFAVQLARYAQQNRSK